jgi:hypothetical protein
MTRLNKEDDRSRKKTDHNIMEYGTKILKETDARKIRWAPHKRAEDFYMRAERPIIRGDGPYHTGWKAFNKLVWLPTEKEDGPS